MSCLRRCCIFVFVCTSLCCGGALLGAQASRGMELSPVSSSIDGVAMEGSDAGEGAGAGQAEQSTLLERNRYGVAVHVGTSGLGVDLGVPVSRHLAVRVGGDFIRYTGTFEDEGATINAFLQFSYAKAQLDYYPSSGNGRFHISPLVVFADNTRVQGNVVIDPLQTISFGSDQYASLVTDPLHGVGRVELRHTAPGLSVGWGNITRGKGHFVFPVEMGFFYVGQPKLTVTFSGTACDVSHPINGCGQIQDDPDFQKDLAAFVARNNHNLTYARYIPILNVGVGYRF